MRQRWLMVLGVAVPTAAAAVFEVTIMLTSAAPPSAQQVVGRIALMAFAASIFSSFMFALIGRNRRTLKEQQRKFDDLFESSSDGLVLVGADKEILACNPRASAMLGYPGKPSLSLCSLCVLPANGTCAGDCPVRRGTPESHFRTNLRIHGGELLAVSASLTHLPGEGETLLRFSDLTLVESREQARLTRLLAMKALEATEQERRRLARELHDGIGQELYALRLAASAGQPVGEMASNLMEDVDRLAKSLWPPVLEKLGLSKALESTFATHENVSLDLPEEFPRLAASLEGTLFRIAQEAVANALKHGSPKQVCVALRKTPAEVVMTIEDDGEGFDPVQAEERLSLGLVGMRERARLVQGVCTISSRQGEGTTVEVQLPVVAAG